MSKKRTSSAESNNDEQTNEGSDSVLQNKDDAKRAKLTSLTSDTTLQDLPIELLGCILVKAVAMEVKGMKLAKSVWKEKAGHVINRLEEVCSQWSSILTTDFFRNEVNRVLDGTGPEKIRLEILHQYPLQCEVSKVTTNKDEIFLLCTHEGDRDRIIHVYDRNNMADVRDVIQLPRRTPKAIAACSVSNCLYVLYLDDPGITMLRIAKDEEHQFIISPWISDHELLFANISVSPNGSLIIASNLGWMNHVLISIYNADGFLQNRIKYLPDNSDFQHAERVIQKSDGNLVVVYLNSQFIVKLTEIDTMGTILRQYQSSVNGLDIVVLADIYGRILITVSDKRIELLDSEFNLLDFAGPQLDKDQYIIPRKLHFNSARNEIVDVVYDGKFKHGVLTIFRLSEKNTGKDVKDEDN